MVHSSTVCVTHIAFQFQLCSRHLCRLNPPNVGSLMVNGKALFYSPEDSKCFIEHTSFTDSHPMVKKYKPAQKI